MRRLIRNLTFGVAVIGAALVVWARVEASEFRSMEVIPSPRPMASETPETDKYIRQVKRKVPVPRRVIEAAVNKIFSSYNSPALANFLAENLPNRSRLLDAVDISVPRDAQLRVVAIRNAHTLNQVVRLDPDGGAPKLISRVAVTVQAKLEFNDASAGFIRRVGTTEFVLTLKQKLKKKTV